MLYVFTHPIKTDGDIIYPNPNSGSRWPVSEERHIGPKHWDPRHGGLAQTCPIVEGSVPVLLLLGGNPLFSITYSNPYSNRNPTPTLSSNPNPNPNRKQTQNPKFPLILKHHIRAKDECKVKHKVARLRARSPFTSILHSVNNLGACKLNAVPYPYLLIGPMPTLTTFTRMSVGRAFNMLWKLRGYICRLQR